MILDCAGKALDLSKTVLMGVLNVTPDSFSDGGKFVALDAALGQAQQMQREGAQIIDIGGESTRPGASEVSAGEEMERVIPVIERLSAQTDCIISIDTSKAEVMDEAVKAGAGLINDVCGLSTSASMQASYDSQVPVCLMHMQGNPRNMQAAPDYENVVEQVKTFLTEST